MVLRTLAVRTLVGDAIVVDSGAKQPMTMCFKGKLALPTDVTFFILGSVERAKAAVFKEYSHWGGIFTAWSRKSTLKLSKVRFDLHMFPQT